MGTQALLHRSLPNRLFCMPFSRAPRVTPTAKKRGSLHLPFERYEYPKFCPICATFDVTYAVQ